MRHSFRSRLEQLEGRLAPAVTATWTGAVSRAWTDGRNWTGGVAPENAGDSAILMGIIPGPPGQPGTPVTNDPLIYSGVSLASLWADTTWAGHTLRLYAGASLVVANAGASGGTWAAGTLQIDDAVFSLEGGTTYTFTGGLITSTNTPRGRVFISGTNGSQGAASQMVWKTNFSECGADVYVGYQKAQPGTDPVSDLNGTLETGTDLAAPAGLPTPPASSSAGSGLPC